MEKGSERMSWEQDERERRKGRIHKMSVGIGLRGNKINYYKIGIYLFINQFWIGKIIISSIKLLFNF